MALPAFMEHGYADTGIARLVLRQLSDFSLQHFALPIHVIARRIMGALHEFPKLRFIHVKNPLPADAPLNVTRFYGIPIQCESAGRRDADDTVKLSAST